ncbi:MAG: isochorismatase family protein [Alphaproteobacteria bacterium]
MRTALMILDMQRSLLEDETWRPDHVLERVCDLEHAARAAGVPVVYVLDSRVEPDGALHARLAPQGSDKRIVKQNSDSFLGTTLQADLDADGIERLVVCGLHTDFYIDTTCRRAASLGYQVVLVEDAHSTFECDYLSAEKVIEHHNRILDGFPAGDGRVSVVRSDQVTFG